MTIIKKPVKVRPEPEDWHYVVQAIKKIAAKKNLSTVQLAELSGIRQPNIIRIFNLKFSPTLKVLQKLAAAVNTEIKIVERSK